MFLKIFSWAWKENNFNLFTKSKDLKLLLTRLKIDYFEEIPMSLLDIPLQLMLPGEQPDTAVPLNIDGIEELDGKEGADDEGKENNLSIIYAGYISCIYFHLMDNFCH